MLNRLRTFYSGFVVCGLLVCSKNTENVTLGFDQKSHQELTGKPWQICRKSVQNPSKNNPKSMKLRPWSVFGAKSRPGRLQDAPRRTEYSTFGAFLVENGAPSDNFGAQQDPNIHHKLHFW